ncbi:Mu transposase C-terminal domain-containing protein [Luteimonas granuli]|uniref:DDE-type integrase/transposase/recombinase n=1 Tax=Luteimonas granuli TaxID=1176533 RepID=A0A518N126_9GAMM|nr:Mu transposase C-terminal domain-containing protein [Luteimonas granuli]QDW65612.1 DDE-type integrase/transposase/recombinase [Luteimonas granuli]
MADAKNTSEALKVARRSVALRVKKGALVVCDGRAATVLAVVSASQLWIKHLGTEDHQWVSLEDLRPYVEQPAPKLLEVVQDDESDFERAVEWMRAFDRYKGCSTLTPSVKSSIAKEMEVSRRTVERHFDLYQIDSTVRGQLPCKPGPEKGSSSLTRVQLAIIDNAIDERYRVEERGSVQATADLAGARCVAAGVKAPCYNTVRARISVLDRWMMARDRHGRVRGDAKAGPAGLGIANKSEINPLDYVQMDHAIVDVIVVDPDTREEIGRPWITLAIDIATRCILGFYLTFDAPSQASVALALEQCCLPRDAWLKSLGVAEPWLPYGLMKTIGWDNAKCFRNTNLIAACRGHGIEPRFRKVRNPVHGAHIERVIGTYMGRVHLLKGTTFSNTKEREDYKSGENAIMTLRELELWTIHEINGRYHNTEHSGLGCTPLEAWKDAWTEDDGIRLPPIPANRRDFRLSLFPRVQRSVGREGVQRFALKYWDEGLIPLIGSKSKFPVAHDPRDISRVYLLAGTTWIDVPWRDRTRAPIALWEWERAKHEVRRKHNRSACSAEAFKHIEAQRELEREAERTTRKQRRDRQRRPEDDRPRSRATSVDYGVAPTLLSDPFSQKS